MISQLELDSRVALCRQLAKREPAHETLWLAEAETWSRFSKEKFRGDVGSTTDRALPSSTVPCYLTISHHLKSGRLCLMTPRM
jgi:hypothetical protein